MPKEKNDNGKENSQKTAKERAGVLWKQMKADKEKEIEKEIEKDERVRKKIEEYDKLISEKEALLDEERQKIKEEIDKIKKDERSIREEEYQQMLADIEKKRISEQKKIDAKYEEAQQILLKAEETRQKKMQEMHEELLKKHEEMSKEYQAKYAEMMQKEFELRKLREDVENEQMELEEENEYITGLRARYGANPMKTIEKLHRNEEVLQSTIEALQESIAELTTKNAQMRSQLRDDNGESLAAEISDLKIQLEDARQKADELVNMPSKAEIDSLREKAKALEENMLVLDEERSKRQEAERKLNAYAMGALELENSRVTAAALEAMNRQLMDRLKQISEQYRETQESKFKTLLEIDRSIAKQTMFVASGLNEKVKLLSPEKKMLEGLVKYIRHYGAGLKDNPLYYSEETIRVFLASLAAAEPASRLLILQGLSGTGKSSLPELAAKALGAECKSVAVQPSWRDSRELLGYDNDFTNRFKETEFTKYLYEASAPKNGNRIYFIVLDEMNLARVEYYFADFLSILEKDNPNKWLIPLISGYSEFSEDHKPAYLNYDNEAANICVTRNIWFIGTANNDDSTSLITDKVYDRAQIMDMNAKEDPFSPMRLPQLSMDFNELHELFEEAEHEKAYQMTPADWKAIHDLDDFCLKDMEITFGNRIKRQMEYFVPVYVACGGTKEEAIDYLLTHKILRKLDERYEPYLVKHLDNLMFMLNETYGEGTFRQSIEKIRKLKGKINPED